MFDDLTKVNVPFGLLDRETQEALKAHGGPWETYNGADGWDEISWPQWVDLTTYRVKPAPPKPREWWATSQILHETKAKAEAFRAQLIAENPGMDFPPVVCLVEATD